MVIKESFFVLTMLLALSMTTAQIPYYSPFPNTGTRIFNSFAQRLFRLVSAFEHSISDDLLETESRVRQLNEAVSVRGNVPALLAEVEQWKNNLWQRSKIRLRLTCDFALQKLGQTVLTIQAQYVRTQYVERILKELINIGFRLVGRIIRIALLTEIKTNRIVEQCMERLESLHEGAVQSGPWIQNYYDNQFRHTVNDVAVPRLNRAVYNTFGRKNRDIVGALDQSRNLLSNL